MANQKRKVCLILDNASSHNSNGLELKATTIVKLLPNMTSYIQPIDAGIIWNMKAHYCQFMIQRALSIKSQQTGTLQRSDLYRVDQLTGMRMAV